MEKAIVTFKNPETEKEVVVKLTLAEDKQLDYEVTNNHNEDEQLDFSGFLAVMFLNSLNGPEDKQD